MRIPRLPLALTSLIIASTPALASGGLSCTVEDEALKLAAQSGVTRSPSGGFFQFKASVAVTAEGVPEDFHALAMDGADLAHSWLDEKELKLLLYRERNEGPFGWVMIVVETKVADEGEYLGSYELTIGNMDSETDTEATMIERTGAVRCFVE